MTVTVNITDTFEKYCTYLCVLNNEDELVDYFPNLAPMNEQYIKTHQDILDSGANNIQLVFADIVERGLAGTLQEGTMGEYHLKVMKPSDFIQAYPEIFIPYDDE